MTEQGKQHRPFGVTLLAILAYVAGAVAVFHTLQMLHLLPIRGPLGVGAFFGFSLFGAFMWGILAVIYFWVGKKLWNLDEQGWLFVVIISILNLIMALVAVLGKTPFEAILPAVIINVIVLIYALLPGTKGAFHTTPRKTAPAQPAAPASSQPAAPASSQPATPPAPAAPAASAPAPAPQPEDKTADTSGNDGGGDDGSGDGSDSGTA